MHYPQPYAPLPCRDMSTESIAVVAGVWQSDLADTQCFHTPAGLVDAPPVTEDVPAAGAVLAVRRIALGRFRVVAELGSGSMGEVVLAEDTWLGRRVAIKRLRGELAGDPRHRRRLRNEARIAVQVDHPGIVRVLDLVCEDGVDHIIMEHVPGPSLRALRGDGALPVARAVSVACELADALDHVHSHGIVHRDVKLENVLTTSDGRPKLNDFGIARFAGCDDDPGEVTGTPRAMSPEQVAGEPVDQRSDLFSLGILLYELVVDASPFAADSHARTMRRVLRHHPRSLSAELPGVPPAFAALVDQLLDKDPARRPQSAREVAARLRELAAGVEVGAGAGLGLGLGLGLRR
jgi:serine/threonine-protein kinase